MSLISQREKVNSDMVPYATEVINNAFSDFKKMSAISQQISTTTTKHKKKVPKNVLPFLNQVNSMIQDEIKRY